MRILLTGKTGQVGWELERALAPLGELIALDRSQLDLAKSDEIVRVTREAKPTVIVNTAAYTAVDQAEREADVAFAVNVAAPGVLADEAKRLGALLVHYSTDYVFDGTKSGPYTEDDPPNPLNAYGRSKLAGEQLIAASGCRYLTLRTSWVYSDRGKNFLLTILRLAREKREIRVVDDQRGAPTWARHIAEATAALLRVVPAIGVYHLAASGETTWCGFAREIVRLARLPTAVTGITSAEYPTAAARPANSLLRTEKLSRAANVALPDWQSGLRACFAAISGERANI